MDRFSYALRMVLRCTQRTASHGWTCWSHKQALVRPEWVRAMTIHIGLLRRGVRSVTAPAERLSIAHYASAAVARPTASHKAAAPRVRDDGLRWAAPYVQRHVEEAMRAHMWPATAA